MVEVGGGEFSRELCGGTHVRATAEIGVVRIVSETSSAANVRRIEAISGPVAIASLRNRNDLLEEIAGVLRTVPEDAAAVVRAREAERRELEKAARSAKPDDGVDVEGLAAAAEEIGGVRAVLATLPEVDARSLPDIADRVRGKLGEGVVVLTSGANALVSVSPGLVERGIQADQLQAALSSEFGGGGGGRASLARAGGGDPARASAAFDRVRVAIAGG